MASRSSFEARADRRRAWPARKTDLASADQDDLARPLEAQAAWDAVMELTAECFALAGVDMTPTPRSDWPVKIFRPGETRPSGDGD